MIADVASTLHIIQLRVGYGDGARPQNLDVISWLGRGVPLGDQPKRYLLRLVQQAILIY